MRRVLIATASVSVLSREAENFFYGRSGDILIHTSQPSDASIVYISESDLIRQSEEQAIDATEIASTVARTLGVVPPTKERSPSFQKTTFFQRAQANLLIALEGVGSSDFENMPNVNALNQGKFPKGQVQQLALKTEPCSADSVGLLSCLSSGFTAAKTGIVGSSWKDASGHRERAFSVSSPRTWSAKANVADRVVQTFDGKSLALSFSGSSQDAAAFCVHPKLADAAANSFCLHPEEKDKASAAAAAVGLKLPRTKEDLVQIFQQQSSANLLWVLNENGQKKTKKIAYAVAAEEDASSVTVTVDGQEGEEEQEEVKLDLSSKVDLDFLLELQSFHTISETLSSASSSSSLSALVKDDAPDVYFGTFSALVPLSEKYGAKSAKVKAARQLLDASVVVFVRAWAQLYEGKVLAEVVAMGSQVDMASALRKVQELAPELTNAADYFPAIYLPPQSSSSSSSSSSAALCETVRAGLKGTAFEASCAAAARGQQRRSLLEEEDTPAPTAAPLPVVSDTERNTYQIMVWVSVAGAFTVLFAFYSTAFMGFKKDTLLYSSFNPKWDDRKTK